MNCCLLNPGFVGRAWRWLWLVMVMLLLIGQTSTPAPSIPAASATSQPGLAPAMMIPGVPPDAKVAVIPITGPITKSTLDFLKYRLNASVENGATLIVLELDTPGGDLLAALDISELLRTASVPTVAWIHDKAYSAGILIASSCDAIVMSSGAVTGDCAPIQITGGQWRSLAPTERAKALSPLMHAFDANAKANDYDLAIFQAMCILDVRLYEVRQPSTGRVRFVNQDDYRVMVKGEDYDTVAAELSTPDRPIGMSMTIATPQEQGKWVLVREIHDGKTLLTVNQSQAKAIGLSKAVASNTTQLSQVLGAQTLSTMPITWSQNVAYWLSAGWVRAILVVIMLLALFVEMHAPGLGVGSVVALTALVLLVGGPMLAGLTAWWHVAMVVVGIVLLLVEIFAIPGFGLVGICGLVMMFVGLTLMGVPTNHGAFNLPPSVMAGRLQAAVLWMTIAIIASGVGFVVLGKYLGRLPLVNRLTLTHTQQASMVYTPEASAPGTGTEVVAEAPGRQVSGDDAVGSGQIKVGDLGRALGTLRPSGSAKFGDLVIDVITDGQWIEPGTKVRVVQSRGSRIVVQRDGGESV